MMDFLYVPDTLHMYVCVYLYMYVCVDVHMYLGMYRDFIERNI